MEALNYKITKTRLLYENYNSMECNNYCDIYIRFYNKDNTRYRRYNFVVNVDDYDCQEYFEEDYNGSKKQKLELASLFTCDIFESYFRKQEDYDNEDIVKRFCEYCNKTINDYNRKVRGY